MEKISSGIRDLDTLIDSLSIGDNVVWEVEAGTTYEVFIQNFIRQAFFEHQSVIYISFNKSPQNILKQIGEIPQNEHFFLLDCFTAGKGKNDRAFTKYYKNTSAANTMKVDKPGDIGNFTTVLNSIEDSLPSEKRYIFDSLTGMQDLWGDENSTYKFFTHMCPRLYDLGTVAYWVLENEAHSQTFKANLRHITQVVLEIYKKRDKLFLKALKLDGRSQRVAFKPHLYEIDINKQVRIFPTKREHSYEIGSKIRELRSIIGLSQKELAERIDLTPSFISQLESNQISPSLNSFLQICNALGVSPSSILEKNIADDVQWLIKKEKVGSSLTISEHGFKGYRIVKNGNMSGMLIVLKPNAKVEGHFISGEGKNLIYVLKGDISVVIDNKEKPLRSGDSIYLQEQTPSEWKNEGGDKAELLLVCS